MSDLRGLTGDLAGFGVEAVDFALEGSTEFATDTASDPTGTVQDAGEAIADLRATGGLEGDVMVGSGGFDVDPRVIVGILVVAALLWWWS